ncbi:hypothetical protein [Kitasatospora sp. NBC_01539]|uniref:hypothetical protein n=1 Tax=Kitasatospora sp. NBC_01539 TaxID=2903577 RepID=UPI003860112A
MPQQPSITSWTRIEPRTRAADMSPGLAAATADPLWLLARQWQVGEFRGEDAGSPVTVRVRAQAAPLARYRPEGGPVPGTAVPIDPTLPLEAVVEREPAPLAHDRRLAAQLGLDLLRALRSAGVSPAIVTAVLAAYPLPAPAPDTGDPAVPAIPADDDTAGYHAVTTGRAPDGLALLRERGPGRIPIPADQTAPVARAVQDWLATAGEPAVAAATGRAWNQERMEYAFAVAARDDTGETVLEARGYHGDRLDWSDLDVREEATLGTPPPLDAVPAAAVEHVVRTVLPAVAAYPGMPATRWWEMEDSRVYWGGITAEGTDLARMLVAEYATGYANDYFLVPLDLPVGSVTRVGSVVVTDTFGEQILIPPAGPDWTLFRPSTTPAAGATGPRPAADLLLTLPTVLDTLDGEPVEEVLLARDEAANLAWAVEHSATGPAGRAVALTPRPAATPPAATAPGGVLHYRLTTGGPENWVPFVPVPDPAHPGRTLLKRLGATARGAVLDRSVPMTVPEEEIPPGGTRVVRHWQLSRWTGGRTVLWLARARGAGRGGASSGLRHDVLEELR